MRKLVRHKPGLAATEDSLRFVISYIGTICVTKTKALISFAVTAKLICVFVFAYAKSWFSHGAAHLSSMDSDYAILIYTVLMALLYSDETLPYFFCTFQDSLKCLSHFETVAHVQCFVGHCYLPQV